MAILLFVTAIALTAYVIDAMIGIGLRRISTSDMGVLNRLMTGQINADVLISGSSRALTHYDTEVLRRATGLRIFNIGQNGSRTDLQLALLKAYLAYNRKPSLVIQNVDLHSLAASPDVYEPAKYVAYIRDPFIYSAIDEIKSDAWKWKYIPLYGYVAQDMRFTWMLGVGALLGYSPKEDRISGYNPRYDTWSTEFDAFRARNPRGVRAPIDVRGIQSFIKLIDVCHDRNIPIILVYSPEFSGVQCLEINRADIFDRFRDIARGKNVPFWDFSASELTKHQSNFRNSQHLTAAGAAKFTELLAQQLVRWTANTPRTGQREAAKLSKGAPVLLEPVVSNFCLNASNHRIRP